MPIDIEILPVKSYTVGGAPAAITPALLPEQHAVTIDPQSELLQAGAPISYDVDVVDSAAAILKIGKLKIRVDNSSGRWTPGLGHFAASDRDHRARVYHRNSAGERVLLWHGFVRKITEAAGLTVDIEANHIFDRLEDVEIPAQTDTAARALQPIETFYANPDYSADDPGEEPAQLNAPGKITLGALWQFITAQTGLPLPSATAAFGADGAASTLWLPDSGTDARRFLAGVLAARRQVLIHNPAGELIVANFGPQIPAAATAANPADPHHVWDSLPPTISIKPLDIKDRMQTAVRFSARGPYPGGTPTDSTLPGVDRFPGVAPNETGDEIVYAGDHQAIDTWPGDARLRYGYRELKQDFEHLDYADAYAAARRVLLDCGYPIRRVIIERDLPDTALSIGDIVDLRVVDAGNFAAPWGGLFWVTGYTVDIRAEKIKVAVNELTPVQYSRVARAIRD